MNRRDGLFAIVGATAIGTMIGVAVGLLFAPKSGDELRNDIRVSGKDFVKKAKERKDSFFDDSIEEIGDFTPSMDDDEFDDMDSEDGQSLDF